MSAATIFEVLPAIDLRGGRVVRLRQGDFERETVYGDDPVAVAARFADAGARWLHVVDLDGARAGTPKHEDVVESIVGSVGEQLRVEVAGGLRTRASIGTTLHCGARRTVIGTAALLEPRFAGELVARYGPDRIAVALDVRGGIAVGDGWRAGAAGVPVEAAMARLADVGVEIFEVTSIDRDGGLGGPDLVLYERLIALGRGSIIASGGIATIDDLLALRDLGCAGGIVGRALLEGSLDLAEALGAVAT